MSTEPSSISALNCIRDGFLYSSIREEWHPSAMSRGAVDNPRHKYRQKCETLFFSRSYSSQWLGNEDTVSR